MSQYIERYIYAVVKRLPETVRKDVSEELRANINDMLSKKPTDEEIESVLRKLGSPRVLANNYRAKERYVVSPVFYDDYINVLKIVFIIFGVISVVFGSIDAVINLNSTRIFGMIFEVFGKVISSLFEGLLSAFAIVTIVFWIISYTAAKSKCDDWKLKDLPEVPKPSTAKISRPGSIAEMIVGVTFSVIWIVVLWRYLDYFGVYSDGVMVAQIFNQQTTNTFIPYYIVAVIIGLIISLLKIYYAEWKIQVTIPHTAYQILSASIAIVFLTHPQLFHQDLYTWVASSLEIPVVEVIDGIAKGTKGFAIFIAVVVCIELITSWYKTLKTHKKDE